MELREERDVWPSKYRRTEVIRLRLGVVQARLGTKNEQGCDLLFARILAHRLKNRIAIAELKKGMAG